MSKETASGIRAKVVRRVQHHAIEDAAWTIGFSTTLRCDTGAQEWLRQWWSRPSDPPGGAGEWR